MYGHKPKKNDLLKQPAPPPLVTKQQQRIEFNKNKNMMESMTKNMDTKINELKEAINLSTAKAEESRIKAEESKAKSDNRLFQLLENLLTNKENNNMKSNAEESYMEQTDMNPEVTPVDESIITKVTQMNIETNSNKLPAQEEENDENDDTTDKNGTSVIDPSEIIKENKKMRKKIEYLEKCVENLDKRETANNIMIQQISAKYDDLIKTLEAGNVKENKQNQGKITEESDPKPYTPNEEDFPEIRKSYSVSTKKPRGVVQESDPSLFNNENLNYARVVTSKKRSYPNYREQLEKNIEEETIKEGNKIKSNYKFRQTKTISMSKKEDLKESIMLDMKKTIGIVTKHERQVDLTIRALESENKIDKNMSYSNESDS